MNAQETPVLAHTIQHENAYQQIERI